MFIRHINLSFFDRMDTSNSRVQIQDYYDRVALTKALPLLTFRRFGQKRSIPQNQGLRIRFTRWGRLSPATTPLVEGVTPPGSKLTQSDITAELAQYGDWVPITDRVRLTAIDPILTEAVAQLGYQEGETMDILSRDALMTGSNAIYAGGQTARSSVVAKITLDEIKKAVRTLKAALAKPVLKQVNATVKYNTTPIRPSFIGICHVYAEQDIEALAGFVPVEKYSSQQDVMEGEFGSVCGVRFIATTQAPELLGAGGSGTDVMSSESKANVYATFIFGEDAYGEVPLSGQSSAVIVKAPTQNDNSNTGDPLNQRSSAGWKAMYAFKILNDLWIVRIEHAVSE